MKLSEYAERKDIHYRTAWNHFHQGKIQGAYLDETGHIVIPDPEEELRQRAALYSHVSTHGQRDDLERQEARLKEFASSRGLEIVHSVSEIGSGVNDQRPKLVKLLNTPDWGVLVVDSTTDSDEGRMEDIFSILYSYAAIEYGKRGAKHRAERAHRVLDGDDGEN